jgi:hypothetical protein
MKSFIANWLQRDETPLGLGAQTDFNFVNFPCEVTGCVGHLEFTVRGENGRAYKVHAAHCLAHLMDYHARVRITGVIKEGMVWAESIIPLGQAKQLQPVLTKRQN